MPLSNLCEPGNYYGSYSTGVMSYKFQHHNFVEGEKWMKGYALKKWESTLNSVFMPMDSMWNLSWKLLAKYLLIWVILSVSLNWITCSYGSDHVVLHWSHFSGKFKHLSCADQYTSPTFTLIYHRVLPPWNLEIIMELHNFLWVLHQVLPSHWFQFFHGLWVIRHSKTPITEPSSHYGSTTLQ